MSVIKYLISLFLMLMAQPSHATSDFAHQQQALDKIIKLANLDQQIAQFPLKIQTQLQQLATASNSHRINKIQTAFKPGSLRQALRRQINISVLAPRYDLLLNRLQTPEINRMLQMERRSQEIVARYERPIFIKHTQRRSPSEERMKLIRALDKAMSHSERLIHTNIILHRQLHKLLAQQPSTTASRFLPTQAELNNPTLHQQHQLELLYTYRKASDKALQAYINFYQNTQGQYFIKTLNSAWLAAINDIVRDITWTLKQPQQEGIHYAYPSL